MKNLIIYLSLSLLIGLTPSIIYGAVHVSKTGTGLSFTNNNDWAVGGAPGLTINSGDSVAVVPGATFNIGADMKIEGILMVDSGATLNWTSNKTLFVGNGTNTGILYNYGTITAQKEIKVEGVDKTPVTIPGYSPMTYPLLYNEGTITVDKIGKIGSNGDNGVYGSGSVINAGASSSIYASNPGAEAHIDGFVRNEGTFIIAKVKAHGAILTGCGNWIINFIDMDVNKDRDGTIDCGNFCTGSSQEVDWDGKSFAQLATNGNPVTNGSGDTTDFTGADWTVSYNNTYSCGTSLSGATYGGPGITFPLPVEIVTFEVTLVDGFVEILWESGSEINNDFYTLERSIEGDEWVFVAKEKGANNSNELLTYTVLDPIQKNGKIYYRLSQTDYDGKKEFFPIKSISLDNLEGEQILLVYPNPASNAVYISGNNLENARCNLLDMNGRPIEVRVLEKDGTIVILTDNVANGMYTLEIVFENRSELRKVFISH